ncbi:MAG: TPM domain-containing protein [Phycisphaerae bacterium]|nr:TPM domain-containing protein [Phycisphaerae bacterium]
MKTERGRHPRRVVAFAAAAAVACVCSTAALAQPRETPRTGIVDMAKVVDPQTEAGLNRWLLELEQKTGAQLKVLTIDTTGGRDVYQYGIETAKRWKLGAEKEDNGALVVIAVRDRKYAIVTGEGIEDTLPDLYCDTIARKCFLPNFKRGDFATGIYQGTVALAKKIAADAGAQLSGTPPAPAQTPAYRSSRQRGEPVSYGDGGAGGVACCFGPLLPLVIFLVIFGSLFSRRRHGHYRTWGGGGLWQGLLLGSLLGGFGRSRGGSSWGGFGGGGFGGGFGGGGGGSFGGGGCSGGW